jgi:hypothetical protein
MNFQSLQISVNFVLNILEAQLQPEDGSDMAHFLQISNMVLTYIFSAELAVNFFSNFFRSFFLDGENSPMFKLLSRYGRISQGM